MGAVELGAATAEAARWRAEAEMAQAELADCQAQHALTVEMLQGELQLRVEQHGGLTQVISRNNYCS